MREFGIQTDEGKVIVGPEWESEAEVIGSAHGGYGNRMTGTLVVRTTNRDADWLPVQREA